MKPALSVCMPYWNRPRELARSMKAYAAQYPDLDIEFSICDDGSITPLEPQPGWKVTRLPFHPGALNPCVPMNAAVRASTRPIIVLTNPEVEHRSPVLYEMLEALDSPDVYVTAACYDPELGPIAGPGTPYGKQGRLPIPRASDMHFCAMLSRELFERAGGFDESYRYGLGCEDNDFLWSLRAAGAQFRRVPGVVWHYRTPHRWTGSLEKNKKLLEAKWGHLGEYQCAS